MKRDLLAEDLELAIYSLQRIKAWKWATDGQKFNGNHKLVLKEVISIADNALFVLKHRLAKKPKKGRKG